MDPARLHDILVDLLDDLHARFGDREPTDEEVRTFLRERMESEGRSAEEIDAILAQI